ncbi:hypothetical protein BH10ACI3_BH10ACI3_13500 [soil metagenome]
MINLFEEAAELQNMLMAEGMEFFFVGGIALQIWGQPRLTTDIDLTVFTGLTNEDERIKWFLSLFKPLIGDQDSMLDFARKRRVLLLKSKSNTEIDVMLGALADMSEEFRRATFQQFTPSLSLKICSADSLIALKTVAGRSQDFADIESVIIKQKNIDWDYVEAYMQQVMEYEDKSANLRQVLNLKEKFYNK